MKDEDIKMLQNLYSLTSGEIIAFVLVPVIGIIILLISAIAFFILHSKIKNKNADEVSIKKINKIQRIIYIWIMILSIIGNMILIIEYKIPEITIYITIILFIISIIVRFIINKKASNIICAISASCIFIVAIWNFVSDKIIENYNEQFLQYRQAVYNGFDIYYVSDTEGLIETVINNNKKNSRKVTIIYKENYYTSVEELNRLLNEIDMNNYYFMTNKYDYDYIKTIKLQRYIGMYLSDFLDYEGNQKGSVVKSLIQLARSKVYGYEVEVDINVIYTSDINQTTTVNISKENSEQIIDLIEEIESLNMYDVYIQCDTETCNIIINFESYG